MNTKRAAAKASAVLMAAFFSAMLSFGIVAVAKIWPSETESVQWRHWALPVVVLVILPLVSLCLSIWVIVTKD